MIDVSIIIVNYNVRYFIEQALLSIKEASNNLAVEIIVIDNASSDDSVEMLSKKFPQITLIANEENVGFGRANNQGITIAKGKYILLLNPDTLLQKNTLNLCIEFIEKTKDCGAIGVKMIDGKGNFLPESKRSLPTPSVALYKMLGLSSIFPKSRIFGKYHLAYLDQNENHQVEVLSGAFMFFRADLLKKIGGFDEDYFMYGEDIDLSYQVLKNGYKNYYLAETSIIHYKGESTKKGSLNYVKVFYEAMLIFAKKHYSPNQAKLYSFAIYLAIFIKGGLTLFNNYFKKSIMTILDFTSAYLGIFLIAFLYGLEVKGSPAYYPREFFAFVLPFYVVIWTLSGALSGVYDKPYKTSAIWKGILIGTLVIAAFYGFFPDKLRFSRAIILLGGAFSIIAMHFHRFLYHLIWFKKGSFELNDKTKLAIIGNETEAKRALELLNDATENVNFVGFINYDGSFKSDQLLGDFVNVNDIVSLYKIEELIFCNKDVPSDKIIALMTELGNELNYKILPQESLSIIGSNSKNSAGDLYAIDVNLKIASQRSTISKQIFDLAISLVLLSTLPVNIWLIRNKLNYLRNLTQVLLGKKSWVGYTQNDETADNYKLPKIKEGILNPLNSNKKEKGLSGNRLNLLYAKNYSLNFDLQIIMKNLKNLGN